MRKFIFLFFLTTICFGQELKSKKILSIQVSVGDYSNAGDYLNLKTTYAPYTKGVFSGIANGTVLPVGGDFPLLYEKDGIVYQNLDIDIVLLTDDGEKIFGKAKGILNYISETFKPNKFQTQWTFSTSSEKYGFLNQVIAVGLGRFLSPDADYMFQHDIYEILD